MPPGALLYITLRSAKASSARTVHQQKISPVCSLLPVNVSQYKQYKSRTADTTSAYSMRIIACVIGAHRHVAVACACGRLS